MGIQLVLIVVLVSGVPLPVQVSTSGFATMEKAAEISRTTPALLLTGLLSRTVRQSDSTASGWREILLPLKSG